MVVHKVLTARVMSKRVCSAYASLSEVRPWVFLRVGFIAVNEDSGADNGACQNGDGGVNIGPSPMSDGELTKAGQPDKAALDNPAMLRVIRRLISRSVQARY